jgi:hypothetical protein
LTHGSQPSYYYERPRWQWYALALAIAAAYTLGAFGFWKYDVDHCREGYVLDALYHAVQLFILHAPHLPPPLNVSLEIGRWLALGFLGLAATTAAYRVFTAELSAIGLGWLKGHVVICGRGSIVLDMVRSQRARKPRRRVVVIAAADDAELIEGCHALPAFVLVGRPSLLLDRARLTKAKRLIAVYEEDGANVEIAVRACALSRASRPSTAPPLECHAQVSDVDLRESLRRHHLPVQDGRCRVHFFDFFDAAARDVLLTQLPLDHDGVSQADPRQVRLVIIGLGAMGRRVAIKAAQLGHFANRRPVRISVIDRAASERERELLFRYPTIRQTCELTFHAGEIDSTQGQRLIEGLCAASDTMTSIAVCLDNDAVALDVAMRLLPTVHDRNIPVAVRMSRPDGLTSLLAPNVAPPEASRSLRTFGWLSEACVARLLDEDARALMAKVVQVNFVKLATAHGRQAAFDEAVKKWEDLSNEDYKESNRQQVDHIAIKLRAVRREIVEASNPRPEASFTREEIELLAEMEHERWVAERLLAGWTCAPKPKNEARRTNPNLIPWAQLDDEIKHYDRDAVRAIPVLIKDVKGMKICRREAPIS